MVDEMNNLQLGKMYLVKEYCWFMFPTKELASVEGEAGSVVPQSLKEVAQIHAKRLSENYKCNVFVVKPDTYVVLLEEAERCYKLLDSNGNVGWIGWIGYPDFSDYFELVKE